jgi:hypothetical protein
MEHLLFFLLFSGIPKELNKYFKDSKFYQPVIRRKNCITNKWDHFNIVRAERPIAKMDLKMEQKECMFCPGNQDKTPRHVKTNGDYIRQMIPTGRYVCSQTFSHG